MNIEPLPAALDNLYNVDEAIESTLQAECKLFYNNNLPDFEKKDFLTIISIRTSNYRRVCQRTTQVAEARSQQIGQGDLVVDHIVELWEVKRGEGNMFCLRIELTVGLC